MQGPSPTLELDWAGADVGEGTATIAQSDGAAGQVLVAGTRLDSRCPPVPTRRHGVDPPGMKHAAGIGRSTAANSRVNSVEGRPMPDAKGRRVNVSPGESCWTSVLGAIIGSRTASSQHAPSKDKNAERVSPMHTSGEKHGAFVKPQAIPRSTGPLAAPPPRECLAKTVPNNPAHSACVQTLAARLGVTPARVGHLLEALRTPRAGQPEDLQKNWIP